MQIIQLIYTSLAVPGLPESEVLDILKKSQSKNASKKISGLLIHREGRFIQLLEGNEQDVLDLYGQIERDPRHSEAAVQAKLHAEKAAMPTWAMGYFSPALTDAARRENAFVLNGESVRLICEALPAPLRAFFLPLLDSRIPAREMPGAR